MGENVTNMCLQFHNESGSLKKINHTNIVFVPKIKDPKRDCYKIIVKVLVNRLKTVPSSIISSS